MQYFPPRGSGTIPPGYVDTNDGDITPATVIKDRVGYSKGARVVGTKIDEVVVVPADKVLVGTTIAGTAGTMPNRGAVTVTPSAVDQTILLGYHNGTGKVSKVTVPVADVKAGTVIAGSTGTMPDLSNSTLAASLFVGDWVQRPGQDVIDFKFVTPVEGKVSTTTKYEVGLVNLLPKNIASGVTIAIGENGMVGTGIMVNDSSLFNTFRGLDTPSIFVPTATETRGVWGSFSGKMAPSLLSHSSTIIAQIAWTQVQRYHVQRLFGDEVLMRDSVASKFTQTLYVYNINGTLIRSAVIGTQAESDSISWADRDESFIYGVSNNQFVIMDHNLTVISSRSLPQTTTFIGNWILASNKKGNIITYSHSRGDTFLSPMTIVFDITNNIIISRSTINPMFLL